MASGDLANVETDASRLAPEVKRLPEQLGRLAELKRLVADAWQDGRKSSFPGSFPLIPLAPVARNPGALNR
jgi:hypothetical protein